jgi:hypothetical protein
MVGKRGYITRSGAAPTADGGSITGAGEGEQVMELDIRTARRAQSFDCGFTNGLPWNLYRLGVREGKSPQERRRVGIRLARGDGRLDMAYESLKRRGPPSGGNLEHRDVPLQVSPITAGTFVGGEPSAKHAMSLFGPARV